MLADDSCSKHPLKIGMHYHADMFDIELDQKWKDLVGNYDSAIDGIIEFYKITFGTEWTTVNDPLEFYQKSEEDMLSDRQVEFKSVGKSFMGSHNSIIAFDHGWTIKTRISLPHSFENLEDGQRTDIDVEIQVRIWGKCRYPYQSPLFIVLSRQLTPVQLLNLSFGIQEAANLEWFGGPMILKAVEWLKGESGTKFLNETPSNYALAEAYDRLTIAEKKMVFKGKGNDFKSLGTKDSNIQNDKDLYEDLMGRSKKKEYLKIKEMCEKLPIYNVSNELVQTIENNSLIIICGDTGIILNFLF